MGNWQHAYMYPGFIVSGEGRILKKFELEISDLFLVADYSGSLSYCSIKLIHLVTIILDPMQSPVSFIRVG